jgi:hypothetical protein
MNDIMELRIPCRTNCHEHISRADLRPSPKVCMWTCFYQSGYGHAAPSFLYSDHSSYWNDRSWLSSNQPESVETAVMIQVLLLRT